MRRLWSRCESCGARIIWAITLGGRHIPVDAMPVDGGNLWFSEHGAEGTVEIESKYNPVPDGADRYVSHFSTCPESKNWRRKQKPQQKGLL